MAPSTALLITVSDSLTDQQRHQQSHVVVVTNLAEFLVPSPPIALLLLLLFQQPRRLHLGDHRDVQDMKDLLAVDTSFLLEKKKTTRRDAVLANNCR